MIISSELRRVAVFSDLPDDQTRPSDTLLSSSLSVVFGRSRVGTVASDLRSGIADRIRCRHFRID